MAKKLNQKFFLQLMLVLCVLGFVSETFKEKQTTKCLPE